MRDCLKAALTYAERGWRVFPLDGKRPFKGMRGYLDGTVDAAQIREWWRRWPKANVGIACSSKHGPLVLDVDGPSGFKLLRMMKLPSTRTAISRKGKQHLYFDPMRNGTAIKRAIRLKHEGKKYKLDILGDGGYVVAPPSIHPDTGRPYKWENGKQIIPFPKRVLGFIQQSDTRKVAPPLPDVIREGERNTLLTSLAGSMRRRDASPEAILAALRETNAERVRPPLPDRELYNIAHSIGKKKPETEDEHFTDLGNARRFVIANHPRVRSVPAYFRNPFSLWDGRRWIADVSGETHRLAKGVVRALWVDALQESDPERRDALLKFATKSESAPRIRAMLDLAATEPELVVAPEALDADPLLLNVHNGTVDLGAGKLYKHRREDLITKLAPVDFDKKAAAPRWEKFLREIFNDDEDLIGFVQRSVGYSLTGETKEHCLFFLYGQGRNGKSTFLEVIRTLLGDYAQQADFNSFQDRRGEGPRNDIARMRGARFVTAIEAKGERGFDETMLKQMTGGDTVVARRLYEDFFEFKPQHKLWLAANHKPVVKEQTEAFWSRIRLIPFSVTIPVERRQKGLADKLAKELSGILNWALKGCLAWKANGLQEPAAVLKATKSYREENDVLGEFLAACCVVEEEGWASTPALYRAFTDWWTDTRGHRSTPLSMAWFGRLLGERPEFRSVKRKQIRGWRGLSVKDIKHD